MDAIKELYSAIYALTAENNQEKPALKGVRYDNGSIVASDGSAMVVLNHPYPTDWEGKILDKTGNEVKARPLNYKAVLPLNPESALRTSDYAKIEDLDELKIALKLMPVCDKLIPIEIEGSVFDPSLIRKVLRAFRAIDQTPEVFIYTRGEGLENRCVMLSENGSAGVVMPLIAPDGSSDKVVTYNDALLCGDLL